MQTDSRPIRNSKLVKISGTSTKFFRQFRILEGSTENQMIILKFPLIVNFSDVWIFLPLETLRCQVVKALLPGYCSYFIENRITSWSFTRHLLATIQFIIIPFCKVSMSNLYYILIFNLIKALTIIKIWKMIFLFKLVCLWILFFAI